MFTGIIEATGRVSSIVRSGYVRKLTVKTKIETALIKKGDSISVSGACLTVVDVSEGALTFDLMEETFNLTSFRSARKGDIVNIERALRANGTLEGHFVLGHVDRAVKIKNISGKKSAFIELEIPKEDEPYVTGKGSIAIDGVSLTVSMVRGNIVRCDLIPYTLKLTDLAHKNAGEFVNVEYDMLGKYINKKISAERPSPVTEEFLKQKGFIQG